MKILFCVRYDFFTKPGGDTVQTKAYIEELNTLGFVADTTVDFENFSLEYDVFHLINLDRPLETYIQLKYILKNKSNANVVISTIHHDMNQIMTINKKLQTTLIRFLHHIIPNINFIEFLKNIIRIFRAPISLKYKIKYLIQQNTKYTNQQKYILNQVNKILLLSDYELKLINNDLNIQITQDKCVVVPNGIDTKLFQADIDYETKSGILCVARIEPRKNQMQLLELAKDLPYHITFIGKVNQNNLSYYEKFVEQVNSLENVTFINGLEYSLLIDKMKNSKLNILPNDAKLIIVGDGEEKSKMDDKVKSLHLENRVELLGHIGNYDVLKNLYANALVSVSPGYVGLSITQSFGFGVPMLISKDENHSPEIEVALDGENSLFFETDSIDSLGVQILKFYSNKQEWVNKRYSICNSCKENYSIEAMSETFLDLL